MELSPLLHRSQLYQKQSAPLPQDALLCFRLSFLFWLSWNRRTVCSHLLLAVCCSIKMQTGSVQV